MEIEFTIKTHVIEDKPSSLKGMLSNEIIQGSRFNCKYTLDPKNEMMIISGETEAEIVKCARHILRIISKHQDWGFYYDSRIIKTTKPHITAGKTTASVRLPSNARIIREYETIINIPMRASIQAPVDKNVLVEDITKEYELPFFLDLLFQEAIFNKSIKKYRVAYLLAFSALERAIKLVCEHHCKVTKKSINELLISLIKDKDIKLRADIKSFDKFKKLRNDIAHGDTQFQKQDKKTKSKILNNLFQELDKMLSQLSSYLILYEKLL